MLVIESRGSVMQRRPHGGVGLCGPRRHGRVRTERAVGAVRWLRRLTRPDQRAFVGNTARIRLLRVGRREVIRGLFIRAPAPETQKATAGWPKRMIWMAPRPGLEPGTCGLTGQGRAGRGATKSKKRNEFLGVEGRGRDAPNPLRTARVGVRPAPWETAKRNNGLRAGTPNRHRTGPSSRRGPVGFVRLRANCCHQDSQSEPPESRRTTRMVSCEL